MRTGAAGARAEEESSFDHNHLLGANSFAVFQEMF